MAIEYVVSPFLNAAGTLTIVGDKAPNESESNLAQYRKYKLIAGESVAEQISSHDVGRPGKAATRKKARATS